MNNKKVNKHGPTTMVDYEPGNGTPDNRCGDCLYFSDGICSNTKVQLDANVPEDDQGNKTPAENDWCDQFMASDGYDEPAFKGGGMHSNLGKFKKFVRFAKVKEVGKGKCVVSGICTSEAIDAEGEICDYKSSKPFYQKWSEGAAKRSQGKSLGNVREMHSNSAVGVVKDIQFNDTDREVWIEALIVDPVAVQKCIEGVYTGFSHGGHYVKVWEDGAYRRYTADPCEQSIVDNPANPAAGFQGMEVIKLADAPVPLDATYQFVARNGSVQLRKFKVKEATVNDEAQVAAIVEKTVARLAKKVKYLVVEKDGTTHLPYTDDDGTPNHRLMGAAWAALHGGYRGKEYEGPNKQQAIARLKRVYQQEGMDLPNEKVVREEARKSVAVAVGKWLTDYIKKNHANSKDARVKLLATDAKKFTKGMYEVGSFANLLMQLASIRICAENERNREGDDSTLPEDLQAELESLADTFMAMAEEEAEELVQYAEEAAKNSNQGVFYMANKHKELAKAVAQFQQALNKVVGTEEANEFGADEPEPIDLESEGTENIQRVIRAEIRRAFKEFRVPGVGKAKAKSQSQSASQSASAMKAQIAEMVKEALKAAGISKAKAKSKSQSQSASQSASDAVKAQVTELVKEALKAAGVGKAKAKSQSQSASQSASDAKKGQQDEMKKQIETTVVATLEGIFGKLAGEAEAAAAAGASAGDDKLVNKGVTPAAGVGDRPNAVANGGPVVKVMPKEKDTTLETPAAGAPAEKADVSKALQGDTAEALKLMKGAQAQSTIPQVLLDSGLGKRR